MFKKSGKLLAGLLCVCMVLSSLVTPMRALASEGEENAAVEPILSVADESEGSEGSQDGSLEEDSSEASLPGQDRNSEADDSEESKNAPEAEEAPSNENGAAAIDNSSESGALTMENHSLKWVSGSATTVITDNDISLTPKTNSSDVSAKAQLVYSCGGNEGVDIGMAEIRLPRYVYYDRNGNPIGRVELSIPEAPATGGATSFNYTFDDHGNDDPSDDEIVIRNYKEILPGGFFMKADIVWKFNAIDVKNGFTADGISASFTTQGNGGGSAIVGESESLSTSVHTSVSPQKPSKKATEQKQGWNSAWGPKPDDADEYYYIVWSLKQPVNSTYSTAPYSIKFIELPGAIDAEGNVKENDQNTGEVIAWATYDYLNENPTPFGTGKSTDFKVGTQAQMEQENVVDLKTRTDINGTRSHAGRDVVMRYPKNAIPQEGDAPVINNGFKAVITTADGEITEQVDLSSHVYQRVSLGVPYPGDTFSMYKRQRAGNTASTMKYPASFAGALNLLRAGKEAHADWSIDVKNMSWTRTDNGQKTYDTVLRDGMMYVAGERLLPEDYELTKFCPAQYDVYLPGYNEDKGYFLGISDDYENGYAPIKVEVKDADGNWSEYGSIKKINASNYSWTGTDGSVMTVNSSSTVALPEGTQDIRYTQTSNAYGVEYRMNLYYKLKPSEHLMNLIGDSTTSFNLININEAWGAQDNAGGENVIYTPGNQLTGFSTPGIKTDVESCDQEEFGGTDVVMHDYAEHKFTAINGTGSFSKRMDSPVNEPQAQRVKIRVNLTYDSYFNYKALGVDIEEAINTNVINESREADFYDLLPPGVDVDLNSISVKTYASTNVDGKVIPPCPYTVELVENWRESGRTMMILHVTAPEGYRNYDMSTTYVDTGFRVSFNMYDSWDNIEANGIGLENNAAFYSKDGKIPGGVSDTGVGSGYTDLFENLGESGGQGELEENVKYSKTTVTVDVPRAAQMGFSKRVKGASDIGYSSSTTVPATGDYSYQMRYALQDNAMAKGVVLYDVLETAYEANEHWCGTFKGIDVTQIKRQYPDIDIKIYYSTSKQFGNLQATSGIDYTDLTNTDLWTSDAPADLSTVTAVAVDLSTNKDGSEVQFVGPMSISAVISMKAPADYENYVDDPATTKDETVYAYNRAFIKQGDERLEGSETTTVAVKKPNITIKKTSNPISGSANGPTYVSTGNEILYTLKVNNLNGADAVTDVKVVDDIPDSLIIDETALCYYFSGWKDDGLPADGQGRVKAEVNGQTVTFTIDKLSAKEYVYLRIPCQVKEDAIGGTKIDNQAFVTEFNNEEWDDFESEETHHKVRNVSVELPVAKKITGANRPSEKTFTFVLEGQDGAPMPEDPAASTVTISGTGSTHFGAINYTKEGDYRYIVSEVIPEEGDRAKGYTYDSVTHHILVHVYRDGNFLRYTMTDDEASAADNGKITFTNEYHPISTDFAIPVEKILGGDPIPNHHTESFEFVLTPASDAFPMPDGANDTVTIDGLDSSPAGNNKTASFGTITFTEAGTYVYQVHETIGNTPGYIYAYDISNHTVTLKVTDRDGQLECSWLEKNAQNNFVTFKNDYEPTACIVSLDLSKEITGHDRQDNLKKSFSFTLSEPEYTGEFDYTANNEALPMPESTTTSIIDTGSAEFGQIAIKHAGVYTYTINEVNENAAGYTYDTDVMKAVVTVVDRGGHLEASTEYKFYDQNGAKVDNKTSFTNSYDPAPAETEFKVTKTIEGDYPLDQEKTFTFTVEPKNGAPMPINGQRTIAIDGEGEGTLENVGPFTEVGTYEYTIFEVDGHETGYSYSDDRYTITVTVTDQDGHLEAESLITLNGIEQESVEFVNTYVPKPVSYAPGVFKIVLGNDRPEGQEQDFTFTLEAVGDAPMPEQEGAVTTVTDQGNGHFGTISFTKVGVYQYVITEEDSEEKGYTYSANRATLTVTVTDDNGVLKQESVYENTEGNNTTVAEFTNVYVPDPVSHVITVRKTILGNERPQGNEKIFTFTLFAKDDAPMPAPGGQIITITDEADASFGQIEYTTAGEYKYEIKETEGDETGYRYETESAEVTVKVTDDHGKLVKEVTYQDKNGATTFTEDEKDPSDPPKVSFINEYHPIITSVSLEVEKTIIGNERDPENKKEFAFLLTPEDDAPMPENGKEIATVLDEGVGAFGEISFDRAGTFIYTVSEENTQQKSYTYSEESYRVIVEVTDNDGVLENKVKILKEAEEVDRMTFENEYHPEKASLELPVEKQIDGDTPAKDESFRFVLKGLKDAPMPKDKESVTINGAGKASFGPIEFTKTGIYEYTVSEEKGSAEGYTYDSSVKTVTVTVTDEDGVLTASWKVDGKTEPTIGFVNTYHEKAAETSSSSQTGVKTGEGRASTGFLIAMILSAAAAAVVFFFRKKAA